MDQVSIGEFARLSRLLVKALRRYDELGLLVPDRVDPDTGYRWCGAGQLERARLVSALRRASRPHALYGTRARRGVRAPDDARRDERRRPGGAGHRVAVRLGEGPDAQFAVALR
ncbi:MAG TPA: MerR family DNA-binding transcriptional regulator [Streptosporangiaceae bacterium]